jgi:hypothetical protein
MTLTQHAIHIVNLLDKQESVPPSTGVAVSAADENLRVVMPMSPPDHTEHVRMIER